MRTGNAIERLNAKLRRSVRIRRHIPNDEPAMKLIWLQLREITQKWKMPRPNGPPPKRSSQWCSAIGSRLIVNEPAQHTKLLTLSF
jgi:hypothetical protein